MRSDFDISGLSPAECILLAERLWEQARAAVGAMPLSDAQQAELMRRLQAFEAGALPPGETWEQVKAGLKPQ